MPGRKYQAGSVSYRYGFNGKENDNDVKGTANQQDYGMRIYDPRLGKFLSVDPITSEYPQLTPYQFASNRPIDGIDRDGLEWEDYGRPVSKIMEYEDHLRKTDPKHAEEIIGQHKINAFITVGSMLTLGSGTAVKAIGYTWAFYQTQRVIGIMNKPAVTPQQKKENFLELKGVGADIFVGLGTGVIVGGVFKLLKPVKAINVDLMGGPTSIEKGSINFDTKAVAGGINDEVKNFSKYFGKNTVSNITVNNPQANFLEDVVNSLKPGGTITVRGTMSNKFFKTIYNGKAQGLGGFTVTEMNPTRNTGMFRTSGEPIQGEIKELQLIKK